MYKFNRNKLILNITNEANQVLIDSIQTTSKCHEKGGVILGKLFPKKDEVLITNIIEAEDNYSDTYTTYVDKKDLNEQINDIWINSGKTVTYLGDWHTHFESNPIPSFIDKRSFFKNYFTSKLNCNFILYCIIGKNYPKKDSIWMRSYNGIYYKKCKFKFTK